MSVAARPAQFDLLETMRWTPGSGFFLLDRHIKRMGRAAAYFEFAWPEPAIRRELDAAVAGKTETQRVRLLLSREGTVRIECIPLATGPATARLGVAAAPVDPANVFLLHKTTHRVMYTSLARPEFDDVVLWTADGQVTETMFGNVVVEIDGRKITPPIETGLLAGTFREELLERGEITERPVTLDELKSATRVWVINSVREWWPATVT